MTIDDAIAEVGKVFLRGLPPHAGFIYKSEEVRAVLERFSKCSYCGTVEPVVPLRELNRVYILKVFWHFERNAARTARALGVGRTTIYRLLAKYKIKLATQQ